MHKAVEAWDRYVRAVSSRIGQPDSTTIDEVKGIEAVWERYGPRLRLWMNVGYHTPDDGLAVSVLVRLDVHAPERTTTADEEPRPPEPVSEVSDVPEWYPQSALESALRRARAEYEKQYSDDELLERMAEIRQDALECGGSVRGLLGRIHTTPVEPSPDTQSFLWAHAFQHPEAPQGRLPAVHLATALADAVNEEGRDREVRVLDTIEPGARLHRYGLLHPDMQDVLATTGREAAVLWAKLRGEFAGAESRAITFIAPPDVVREMRRRTSAVPQPGKA
ncbi:hypothetical protein [Streptomyces sp. AC495_CC817]|uniref:hypothetical protein n=1 Tax=Streptomyces sp. AC495_CC817 TaxID=2823900 RepID=UPI001C2587E7|nr:hypothetical protein [Streptomyces sp. AC495_CC817]